MRLQLQNNLNQPLVQGHYQKFQETAASGINNTAMTTITTQLPSNEEQMIARMRNKMQNLQARRMDTAEDILDTISTQQPTTFISAESPHQLNHSVLHKARHNSSVADVHSTSLPPVYKKDPKVTEMEHAKKEAKLKALKVGRCPTCTLKPPCQHFTSLA